MKKLSFLLFFTIGFIVNGQNQLNEYKYIIVPKQFNNFKKENQYQTSTLVKYLFIKKGFNAIYKDALPEELSQNRCKGLFVEIKDESSMFITKTTIVLKDCTEKEIFVTQQGTSRLKEYKPAYMEALTKAFQSFDGLYKYSGKAAGNEAPITVSFKNDVKKLEEKISKNLGVETSGATKNEKAAVEVKKEEVKESIPQIVPVIETSNILYAQQVSNGYQLVDSTPSIRLKIYKSSISNMYLATDNDTNGLVYNKDGKWFFEYYKNGELKIEELNIKF